MAKIKENFNEHNAVIDELKESLNHQGKYMPVKSNLKPFQANQAPSSMLSKRIDAEVRRYQILAGLTPIQRKILFAKLDTMKLNSKQTSFKNFVYDGQIAELIGVAPESVTKFNQNATCRDALIMCTKIIIESNYSDIISHLWIHGKKNYQPLIKLLEIIDEYTARHQVQSENKNLNVNVDAQTTDGILRQIIVKLGSVGYNKDRLLSEVAQIYDQAKEEGSF